MFYLDLDSRSEQLAGSLGNAVGLSVASYRDLRSIPSDEMRQLIQLKGQENLLSLAHSFFRRGAVLWLARIGESVVGLQWTLRGGFKGFYRFPLTDKDAVVIAVEVFPAFRGRGIFPEMAQQTLHRLLRSGVSRAYWSVRVWNAPMLRSSAKLNATRIGVVKTFSLFHRWITVWDKRSLNRE